MGKRGPKPGAVYGPRRRFRYTDTLPLASVAELVAAQCATDRISDLINLITSPTSRAAGLLRVHQPAMLCDAIGILESMESVLIAGCAEYIERTETGRKQPC